LEYDGALLAAVERQLVLARGLHEVPLVAEGEAEVEVREMRGLAGRLGSDRATGGARDRSGAPRRAGTPDAVRGPPPLREWGSRCRRLERETALWPREGGVQLGCATCRGTCGLVLPQVTEHEAQQVVGVGVGWLELHRPRQRGARGVG